MTEPLDVLILNTLMTRLTTPALDDPATPIASPLVAYTPTDGVPYFKVWPVMRAATEHFGLAFENPDMHRGIFQVDAVVPDGNGEAPGLRLASVVVARFPIGTVLAAGAFSLRIQIPATIAAAVKDAPWVRFPVSIPYLVIT